MTRPESDPQILVSGASQLSPDALYSAFVSTIKEKPFLRMIKADESSRLLRIISSREYDPTGLIEIIISAVPVIREGSRFVVRMNDRDYARNTSNRKRHGPLGINDRLEHVLTEQIFKVSSYAPTHDKFGLNIP